MTIVSGIALVAIAAFSVHGLAGSFKTEEAAGAALQSVHLAKRGRLPPVVPLGKTDGMQLLNAKGEIMASTPNLVGAPRMADFAPPATSVRQDREVCDIPRYPGRCMDVVAFRIHRDEGDWVLYAAAGQVPWYVRPELFTLIVGGSLAIVAVTAAGTYRTVTSALVPVRAIRRERRVPVDRDLTPGVAVVGNRLRLARLLTNLMDNAERHAVSRISVRVHLDGGTAVMEVSDDGAGIAPAQRELVFQRFTRLDASRHRDAGGTGLGLPIAREIAHTHGGLLRLEDSVRGARFVLRLPPDVGPERGRRAPPPAPDRGP
ncbi:ATP-binding protein [Streptosporangium sp. NPDC002524]|uniref:sensor histidine kinase n=1 Tax=Streptosporangium sp. NPDC002524 TaxID=3154537 RepID=UPI00332912F5